MKQFKDKVAVITGGASGIGLALARRAAAEGMQVVLADIEDTALAAAADELKGKGAQVLTVKCDVSRAEDVEHLAAQTLKACGGVHLVCNNAGVGGVRVKTWEASARVGVSVLCPAWVGTNIWNAQRNRPAELLDHAETEEERARREEVRALLEKGKVTAADVADMTFEAVAGDRFYIFPHPKIRRDIQTRMEDILELRNPTRTA